MAVVTSPVCAGDRPRLAGRPLDVIVPGNENFSPASFASISFPLIHPLIELRAGKADHSAQAKLVSVSKIEIAPARPSVAEHIVKLHQRADWVVQGFRFRSCRHADLLVGVSRSYQA